MFIFKKKYFLIIESIKDINLKNLKKNNKFIIIYRSGGVNENLAKLIDFRKKCSLRKIKFFVANDIRLCVSTKSDGIYLSSFNRSFKALNLLRSNFKIIGSAHNASEIFMKVKQGCDYILLSKLFFVRYDKSAPYLDLVKFSKYQRGIYQKLIPLGGINSKNLNKLKTIDCEGFALMSEIKKKPAISNRLF